jgi:monoamine oxidase
MEPPCDVLIVGAGLSGLMAARRLQAEGRTVRLLEARPRVGGRMHSTTTAAGSVVDLGGQWGGATHHRFAALLEELGLTTFPSYYDGQGVFHWRGRRVEAPIAHQFAKSFLFFELEALGLPQEELEATARLQQAFHALVRSVPPQRPWDTPDAARLDRLSVAAWAASLSPVPLARLPLDWLCRVGGSGGFEPWEASILHLAWTQAVAPQAESPEAWLVQGGAGAVALRLAADLEAQQPGCLRLGVAAQQIEHNANGVRLQTSDGVWQQADLAIVAVPPPQRAALRFEPPLPAAHRALLQRSPMGGMTKVLATYARPFWRERGLNGLAIGDLPCLELTADSGPPDGQPDGQPDGHSDWRTNGQPNGQLIGPLSGQPGVLASFLAGERALTLGALPAERQRQLVLADLVSYWGPQAGEPLDLVLQPWNGEPWTGGAFTSFLTPGTWTSHARVAAQGSEGPGPAPLPRVLWAGTEVSPRWPGYFEGALEAAEWAVVEALARLEA